MAMPEMASVPAGEQPRTSLKGVDRRLTQLSIDGTAKDFAALRESKRSPNCRLPAAAPASAGAAGCRLPS